MPGGVEAYRYDDLDRAEVLPFVPPDARRILDVGCGRGGFGRAVRLGREAELWGVETSAAAAGVAAGHYDRVVVGAYPADFEGPDGGFDCIVFNDVLEHMADPWGALRATHRWVRPGGSVLASIPNVRNCLLLRDLVLHDRWSYADIGILDRTHLRFFTRTSIRDLFRDTGYAVEMIEPVNFVGGRVAGVLALLPRTESFRCLQYVVRARPNQARARG